MGCQRLESRCGRADCFQLQFEIIIQFGINTFQEVQQAPDRRLIVVKTMARIWSLFESPQRLSMLRTAVTTRIVPLSFDVSFGLSVGMCSIASFLREKNPDLKQEFEVLMGQPECELRVSI